MAQKHVGKVATGLKGCFLSWLVFVENYLETDTDVNSETDLLAGVGAGDPHDKRSHRRFKMNTYSICWTLVFTKLLWSIRTTLLYSQHSYVCYVCPCDLPRDF